MQWAPVLCGGCLCWWCNSLCDTCDAPRRKWAALRSEPAADTSGNHLRRQTNSEKSTEVTSSNRYAKIEKLFKKAAYTSSLHASYKLAKKIYYLCWVFLLWCWQEVEQRAHACNAYRRNSRTLSSRFSAGKQLTKGACFAKLWQKTMKMWYNASNILILKQVSH